VSIFAWQDTSRYNKEINDRSDDMNFTAQDVEQMIQLQHDFYYTGATKSAAFRKQQLAKLKHAIQLHEEEIMQALYKDLRKSEFEAYATEVGFVLDSIGFMTKH
jgi:aldehyde dehydrogenase (NAD+)